MLGLEAAGIIEKVGSNIDGFGKREEVFLTPNITPTEYGFLREYVVAPIQAVIKKPKNISFKKSAAIWMAYGTAYAALILNGSLKKSSDKLFLFQQQVQV
ncbi:hypothetical protein [Maribacter sp. 2-571]|uniref:hypothetical protein n=1 Tax=Maribacter sp. 2-571 TaxID=3417569 RepID=UPI003D33D296